MNKVYLTFSTEKETSDLLKLISEGLKMTQPELIEKICKDFINDLNKIAEEELNNIKN